MKLKTPSSWCIEKMKKYKIFIKIWKFFQNIIKYDIFSCSQYILHILKCEYTRGVHKVSFPLVPQLVNHNASTSGTSRVLTVASSQRLKMETLIPALANCEVRSVIKFLNAQSIAPIEIRRQLCQFYSSNVMSKQLVRRWCRQFTAGRQHVHDVERSGRPSIITDDLVELVRKRIMENRCFRITELSSNFPLLIVQNCHGAPVVQKIVCQVGSKATGARTQSKARGACYGISAAVPCDGDEFLDRIITGGETWVVHITPETKQQSMHWRHIGSPYKTKFK